MVPHDFLGGGGNVHRQIHHRAGRCQNDRADENIRKIEIRETRINKRLHKRQRRAVHVQNRREEIRRYQRSDDAKHRAEERRKPLARPPRHKIHNDGCQHENTGETRPRRIPTAQAQRNEQLPHGDTAEHETEKRFHARPPAEHRQQRAENPEQNRQPTHAPMIPRDERLRAVDDERHVARRKFFVQFQLRPKLVRRFPPLAAGQFDREFLRAELNQPVALDSRVVRRNDARPHRRSRVLRERLRSRQKKHSRATEHEDKNENRATHHISGQAPSKFLRYRCCR